jgi:hypothetical protein
MTRDVDALQELPEVDNGAGLPPRGMCIPPTCVVTGCRGTRGTFEPLTAARWEGEKAFPGHGPLARKGRVSGVA